MADGKDPEVLHAHDGLELVQYADGRRELRLSGHMLHTLEAAFDAIVAWYWVRSNEELTYTTDGFGRPG